MLSAGGQKLLSNLTFALATNKKITTVTVACASKKDYNFLKKELCQTKTFLDKLKVVCSSAEDGNILEPFGQKCLKECDIVYFNWPHIVDLPTVAINKPAVCTVQDTTNFDFGLDTYIILNEYYINMQKFLNNMNLIITPSCYVKERTASLLKKTKKDIVVINHYHSLVKTALSKSSLPPPGSYFICPTNLEPHKNVSNLFLGWKNFQKKQELPLILIGPNTHLLNYTKPHWSHTLCSLIDKNNLKPNLDYWALGCVPDDDKTSLIKNAIALINPSLAEGGGSYPVEEALMLKTPILCSDIPPIREQLAGRNIKSVLLFDPENPITITYALNNLLQDYEALKAAAQEVPTLTTNPWIKIAQEYVQAFKKTITNFEKSLQLNTPDINPKVKNNVSDTSKLVEKTTALTSTSSIINSSEKKPKRILLICQHDVFNYEETRLLTKVGFEVIIPTINDQPLKVYGKSTLDKKVINNLKRINFSADWFNLKLDKSLQIKDQTLLNEHIDIIVVTVLLREIPTLLAWFKGYIVFKAWGYEDLHMTYTNRCNHFNINLNTFLNPKYIWSDISETIRLPEDKRLYNKALSIIPYVSQERVPSTRWKAHASQAVCCNIISQISTNPYNANLYEQHKQLFKKIPLKIFGNNHVSALTAAQTSNPEIIGFLDTTNYYDQLRSCRVMFYHTANPHHLHYHPIEALALGLPVLFHKDSIIAVEARKLLGENLKELGCYTDYNEALSLIKRCLDKTEFALDLSLKQRPLTKEVFTKERALKQALKLHEPHKL
jgi:glycosyltransferase involved in cell wall biosynthesis